MIVTYIATEYSVIPEMGTEVDVTYCFAIINNIFMRRKVITFVDATYTIICVLFEK